VPPSSTSTRVDAGAAFRRLADDLVGHDLDDALLTELTEALASFSTRIAGTPRRAREKGGFHEHWETAIAEGEPVESFEYRPISGAASPWSLDPDIRREGNGVRATLTFGSADEGAPERCHGGLVAALFDDVLGSVLSVVGEGAFTGELTVRYLAPVPLHRELVCTCWIEGRDGRKLYLHGELRDGETLLSTAKSVFIQPRDAPTQSTFDPS
jgi:acyl-coenzyme A thioesterase PaaI-like protein